MLIKTIEDNQDGRKWEIFKESDNNYSYKYYEYFQQSGWRFTAKEDSMSKDAIEWEFDILV